MKTNADDRLVEKEEEQNLKNPQVGKAQPREQDVHNEEENAEALSRFLDMKGKKKPHHQLLFFLFLL